MRILFFIACLLMVACHHAPSSKVRQVKDHGVVIAEIDDFDQRDGTAEARADIARGDVRLLIGGDPAEWIEEFASLLRKKLGVSIDYMTGGVVSEPELRFVHDYNDVVIEHLGKRFGSGILDSLKAEAIARYSKSKRWPNQQSEGTPGSRPPSNQSSPPGVPHL